MIGVTMGINNLLEISTRNTTSISTVASSNRFGACSAHAVKLYIYPMRQEAYDRYLNSAVAPPPPRWRANAFAANVLITAKNVHVADHLSNL